MKELRTYIKSRISSIGTGYKEHDDGFDRENIPRSLLNKSYHISIASAENVQSTGQINIDRVQATLQIFYKGYRSVRSSAETSYTKASTLRDKLTNPANFTSVIKGCRVNSISVSPLSEDNNNSFIIDMEVEGLIVTAVS